MKFKLNKTDICSFLQNLMDQYDLFAPVEIVEGVSVYKRIERPEEVALGLSNSRKPLKDVFFSQSEVMLGYEKIEGRTHVSSTEEVRKERVVLGARPCDIQALSMIEDVYSGKEYTDVYFKNKRERTTIIGMACSTPLSTCFCSPMQGGPFSRKGSDIFLIDLHDRYLVEPITEKGVSLLGHRGFEEASAKEADLAEEVEKKANKKMESSASYRLAVQGIEKKLEAMVESPIWDRIHEKCIGCNTCTFLCPTCHCFDIADQGTAEKGRRVRNWDSCLSSVYSLETSGHNPRPTARERTRQRLMHKLNYFPKLFGKIACVGCGRCVLYCPVNFDIRQAIEEIQKEKQQQ